MSNKYCNLPGGEKISETFGQINVGFASVETDIDDTKEAIEKIDQRVDQLVNNPDPNKDLELVDLRNSNIYGVFPTAKARLDNTDNLFSSHLSDNPVYVTDFMGVDRTGTTDSSQGIKNAIEYALENNREVRFPDGVYLINSGNQIGIDINGFSKLKITGTGNVIIRTPDGATETRPFVLRNGNGLEISGLTFECLETTDHPINGLDIMNCNNVHVHHCNFYNQTFYGLGIFEDTIDDLDSTCDDLIVENCYFYGVRTIGLEVFPKVLSNNQIIRNNKFDNCGNSTIAGNGCALKCGQGYVESEVYGNEFINCGYGTGAFCASIINWYTCNFYDNKFTNCKRSAIVITLGTHPLFSNPENYELLIHHNTITRDLITPFDLDPAISVAVTNVTKYNENLGKIRISNNNINRYYRGISILPMLNLERLICNDNEFTDIAEIGVYSTNTNGGVLVKPIIMGNKFFNNNPEKVNSDIDIRYATSPIIQDNKHYNSGEYALKLISCTGSIIVDKNSYINGNVTNIASRGAILISDSVANNYYLTDNKLIGGNWTALFTGTSNVPTIYAEGNVLPSLHRIASNATPTIVTTEILGKYNSYGDTNISGYIEVKDINNVTRKVAVVS